MSSRPTTRQARDPRRLHYRHFGQYFLRGILVLAPVVITATLVVWLFRKLDGLMNPYVNAPGAGLVALIVLILLIGWVSSFFIVRKTFKVIDEVLEALPGISFIYSAVRDFLEAFAGRKRRFTQAVLVNVFSENIWLVGFLTDENAGNFNLGDDYVSVYVPQAYNVAGQLYVVPRDRVRPIEDHASSEVMKYALSGGAVEVKIPGASPGAFDKTTANSSDRHAIHTQTRSPNQAGASSGVSDPQRINTPATSNSDLEPARATRGITSGPKPT